MPRRGPPRLYLVQRRQVGASAQYLDRIAYGACTWVPDAADAARYPYRVARALAVDLNVEARVARVYTVTHTAVREIPRP